MGTNAKGVLTVNIIDAHIHPFEKTEQRSGRYGEQITDKDVFRSDLERAGITHCCGSVIVRNDGTDWEVIRQLNDTALRLRDYYEGFYTPGFHIHPNFVRESCEEIERMHRQGVRLIGELVPYMMGWREYAQKEAAPIFELAQEKEMTVNVHPTTAEDLEQFAKMYPRLNILVAHPRDGEDYAENLRRIQRHDNVFLDLSGTGLFRYGMLRKGLDQVGKDRLIFGTDYPICNPGMYVEAVLFENLSDEELEAVFEKNARRLIIGESI